MAHDDIIEGTAIVVSDKPVKEEHRFQITIIPLGDKAAQRIDNFKWLGQNDKANAWECLVEHIMKNTNRLEYRKLLEGSLLGQKPAYKKVGSTQHTFGFTNREGEFIESFVVNFLPIP